MNLYLGLFLPDICCDDDNKVTVIFNFLLSIEKLVKLIFSWTGKIFIKHDFKVLLYSKPRAFITLYILLYI